MTNRVLIKGHANGIELPIKRLHLGESYEYLVQCPQCWTGLKGTLDGDKINYPKIGEPYTYSFYCNRCQTDSEFEILVYLISPPIILDNKGGFAA